MYTQERALADIAFKKRLKAIRAAREAKYLAKLAAKKEKE